MSRRAQENVVALAFLLVFAFFIAVSMTYSPRARLVPVPIAAVSVLLLLLQLWLQNFRTDIKLNVDSMDLFAKVGEESLIEEKEPAEERRGSNRKELTAFGLVAVYLAMVLVLGMMPATFLYVLGYFLFVGKEKWYKSLIWSAATVVVLDLLFVEVIQVSAYEGWLVSTFLGG